MIEMQRARLLASAGLAVTASGLALAACGGGSHADNKALPEPAKTSWSLPGGDLQNTRHVGGPINASSVSQLGVAWTVPITATSAFGGFASTPVVAKGVMYTQDLASNVQAVDFKTGKILWTTKFDSPDEGPNGVTVVDGTVYDPTPRWRQQRINRR